MTLRMRLNARLEVLTRILELLGIEDVSFASYSAAIARMQTDSLSLAQTKNTLQYQKEELETELDSLKHELFLVQRWKNSVESAKSTEESVESMERRRGAILKKAREYHDELNKLLADGHQDPPVTVTKLLKQQEKNKALEQELKAKRAKIQAFQGLPPDIELARLELIKARDEQMKLIQIRERSSEIWLTAFPDLTHICYIMIIRNTRQLSSTKSGLVMLSDSIIENMRNYYVPKSLPRSKRTDGSTIIICTNEWDGIAKGYFSIKRFKLFCCTYPHQLPRVVNPI
ncbi:hypothetical protein BDQ17DRAFT_1301673 [Cyathus striatus]|nr:hypothetical protein BDQ17DRAFT_1301673 [Cyathus striatus]